MFQIKSNAPEFEECSDLDNCMCECHEKDREPKIVNYLFPLNLDGIFQHRQLGCFDKKITFWGVVMVYLMQRWM